MKPGDKVKIISAPKVENQRDQSILNLSIGKKGTIDYIFKHGERNIIVVNPGFLYNYYAEENLELIK